MITAVLIVFGLIALTAIAVTINDHQAGPRRRVLARERRAARAES